MKRRTFGLLVLLTIFSTGITSGFKYLDGEETDNYNYTTIEGARLPKKIDFAGEAVPLNQFDVRESLDKELQVNTYWHSSTLLTLKRASRWFPVIEPILKANNIPDDFKYLALIESGLQQVKSPAGAAGFWQIMESTAREHGLEVNKDVDERKHVEKSTQVACEYLQDSYERFGNWTLAAASYNAGKRRIRTELERQKVDSYYDLYLNTETTRYIYRILAIKNIYENQKKFGFELKNNDLYKPLKYREVSFTTEVKDLIAFAKKHGTTYKMLKKLNPWLVNDMLRNSTKKKYTIKLPK